VRNTTARIACAALVLAPALGLAADPSPAWPPSDASRKRIGELQAVLASREASDAQRRAAREELASYLRLGKQPLPGAPRAATSPVPGYIDTPVIGKSFSGSAPPASPPVAHVAPASAAPAAVTHPVSGNTILPTPGGAVDPRTGTPYVETPSGYLDPRTGQVVPRR
jgi:hypothetical protein